jgi:primase-polymerase (primpol)-like protein
MRSCRHCSSHLSPLARADARYCSGRCRVASLRSRPALPIELTSRHRWIRRSKSKVPLTYDDRVASSTNSSTWCDFELADASTAGAGLGFVLDGDGVVCIDIDHCVTDGKVADWAQTFIDSLPETYTETSPSGDGLHIWGFASLPFGGKRVQIPGGELEVYGDGRYITITGHAVDSTRRLADLTAALSAVT